MIQDVKYDGYSANPSDYECTDGELAMALGVVPEDGALKTIMSPSVIFTLHDAERLLYIHRTSEYVHYIIFNEDTETLVFVNQDDLNRRVTIGQANNLQHANAISNTLLVFSNSAINYYLWKGDSYLSLGDHLPDIEISFGLIGRPRLFSKSDESKSMFNISFNPIKYDDKLGLLGEFTEDNKTIITEQVMAKVNKFIAQETVNKGRFCFPFLVRYALRLYDGSLVCHSAPVLMNPATRNSPVVFTHTITMTTDKEANNADMDIMLVAASLDYSIIKNSDYNNLNTWTDIIKSVDVFISKPLYTFDQSGKVKSFENEDTFDSIFIGKLYKKGIHVNGQESVPDDYVIGPIDDVNVLDSSYLEWKYSHIYTMYFDKDRTPPQLYLHLPEFSEGKMDETINNTATFYKLCSLDINEIKNGTDRKEIVVDDSYLQSLVTREVMTDDYLTHDKLYAKYSFVYNNRINLAGVERMHFRGFLAQTMFSYLTHPGYSYAITDVDGAKKLTISVGGNVDSYRIDVYIKEEFKDYKVSASTSYDDIRYISAFLSPVMSDADGNRYLRKRSWGTYFFYPNANAYKMVIYNNNYACYELELKPHDFLNGAYAKIDYDIVRENNISTLPDDVLAYTRVDLSNKIYTSEVNNPFYFPLLGINTISGEIIGISSAAKALSEGQFGQFPLYAFTSDGVWALEVSATGTYSARQPISRDVCINTDSITQIDNAVLFASDRGIMLVSGSTVQCVSDMLKSENIFNIQGLPQIDKIINLYNKSADINEKIPIDITLLPFIDFLKDCRIIYDYINQRIIVYNPGVKYAYVYSLKSKLWGMMHSNIMYNVNSYPNALAVIENTVLLAPLNNDDMFPILPKSHVLADFSYTKNSQAILMITRPFTLGDPKMFKTIDTIIQRGMFKRDHISQVLYGSNDLYNWHVVYSSVDKYMRGFRGSPYKAYRIAIVGRLDKDESIYGFTAQFNWRMLNQPR